MVGRSPARLRRGRTPLTLPRRAESNRRLPNQPSWGVLPLDHYQGWHTLASRMLGESLSAEWMTVARAYS